MTDQLMTCEIFDILPVIKDFPKKFPAKICNANPREEAGQYKFLNISKS